jgi:hypothetical protein
VTRDIIIIIIIIVVVVVVAVVVVVVVVVVIGQEVGIGIALTYIRGIRCENTALLCSGPSLPDDNHIL